MIRLYREFNMITLKPDSSGKRLNTEREKLVQPTLKGSRRDRNFF